MDRHVIQKKREAEAVFRTMVWNPVAFKEELSAPREILINSQRKQFVPVWVVPSRWVAVFMSAEVVANYVPQMGALNATEPLSDGYTVQLQSANH